MCLEKKFPSNNSLIIIIFMSASLRFAFAQLDVVERIKKKLIFNNIQKYTCYILYLPIFGTEQHTRMRARVEFVTLRSYLPNIIIIIIISEYMRCHFQNIYYDYYLYILVWHLLNTSQSSLWSAKLNFIFL